MVRHCVSQPLTMATGWCMPPRPRRHCDNFKPGWCRAAWRWPNWRWTEILPPAIRTCGSMTAILGLASTDPVLTRPPTSSRPAHCCGEELTVERFAKWIVINDSLDGLASVVAPPINAPLQIQVLAVTSLVEGLHRRMPTTFEQSKFARASPSVLKRIKEAARRAARATATGRRNLDPAQVDVEVTNAVSRFDEVDYRQRASDVVAKVCAVIPEIAESLADLPECLTKVRHEMGHQLPLDDEQREPLEVRYLRWLVVATITPWLLRGLLLLKAGIDPSVLHDGYLAYGRFLSSRADVAQLVRELDWELPSSN